MSQRTTDNHQDQLGDCHAGEQRVGFDSYTQLRYDEPLKRQRDENVGAGQKGESNRLFHAIWRDMAAAV